MNALNEERYQLAIKLAATQDGNLKDQVQDLSDQIDDLELKLETEIIVVPLDGENLKRMAMNHLENQINTAQRAEGVLKNFDGISPIS